MGCSMTCTEVALLLRVVRMVKRPSPTEMASRPPWKFSCLVRWSPLAPGEREGHESSIQSEAVGGQRFFSADEICSNVVFRRDVCGEG